MIDLALFVVALAALGYTLLPFVHHGRVRARASAGAEDLFIAKERIYANIKDLDFDHEMGKVDDADYRAMRAQLKQRAAQILDQIDRLHGDGGREALEREIARHRSTDSGACRQCGEPLKPGVRFCPQCGQAAS